MRSVEEGTDIGTERIELGGISGIDNKRTCVCGLCVCGCAEGLCV